MILRLRLIFLISLLVSQIGVAQDNLRFNNKSIEDGLSQSYVSCIVQDDLNSLWIGTQDGLNRFDGKSFEVFNTRNKQGLSSQFINVSIKDKNGNLWFGTDNGLTKYSVDSDKFESTLLGAFVSSISFDGKEKIWVSTSNQGVFSVDVSSLKPKSIPIFNQLGYRVIFAQTPDSILVANHRTGLELYTNGKKELIDDDAFICEIQRTQNDQIVVCSQTKVQVYKNGTCQVLLDSNLIGKIVSFKNVTYHNELGWLFCTENNGLLQFDKFKNVTFYKNDLLNPNSILNNSLNCFWTDNFGYLWIGSNRGISSFDPNRVGFLSVGISQSEEGGLPNPNVWCFNQSIEGDLMIGTARGVSIRNKQYEFEHYLFPESSRSIVLAIEPLSAEEYLISSSDALYKLRISDKKHQYEQIKLPYKKSVVHRRFYRIIRLNQNELIIGTSDGAIIYNQHSDAIQYFEYDPNDEKNTIQKGVCRTIFKDSKDRVWLSTSAGGLNELHYENGHYRIQPFSKNEFFKREVSKSISCIYESKDGKFYFATNGSGVVGWDLKSTKVDRFNYENGLPNDVVYGILSDQNGNLWVSTNQGLASINLSKKLIHSYNQKNGLGTNEFNFGSHFRPQNSKQLYFGGINGYTYFDPSELDKNVENLSVVFTRLSVQNEFINPDKNSDLLPQPVSKTKELHLGYRKRDFTLFFQSSRISNSDLIQFKYKLSGEQNEEGLLGNINSIRFNALAPGSYTLKVFARVGAGEWCTQPATINIIIAAPLWQKSWFWIGVLAVLGFFIWWFIRQRMWSVVRTRHLLEKKIKLRTKKIQEKNKEIERQAKVIEAEKNKVLDQQRELEKQKVRTEQLLKSAIPEFFVEKLLNQKRTSLTARGYKMVSIMFTDFVGFTKAAENLTPSELVKILDTYFKKMDQIILKHNLERIKTIGDSYMCAGGLPVRNKSNPIETCLAALEIQAFMEKRKNDAIANGREYWELRIGVNTGNVTGGVIGTERLAFDVWGAAVNRARRMEETGIPGRVCISDRTYEHVASFFDCTEIGEIDSKGREKIKQYVIDGIKPELCKKDGITPNSRFYEILNLHLYSSIQYQKAEFHIMRELQEKLPDNLFYHSIKHTKDVVEAVERIALSENVTDEGLFLLKSAANYHDAGFTEQYAKNEPIGAAMAEKILPNYGYSTNHIDKIKELIYVTAIPHEPKNLLEEIICDADLDYLGRDDFHEIADTLYQELKDRKIVKNKRAWDEIQVKFLSEHKYFTKTSIKTRKIKKAENLAEIKQRLEEDNY